MKGYGYLALANLSLGKEPQPGGDKRLLVHYMALRVMTLTQDRLFTTQCEWNKLISFD